MKMLVLVYNDSVDEVVVSAFKKANIEGYTKWRETVGEGRETEPKLGTHSWPGKNNVLAVVVPDDTVSLLKDVIQKIKGEHPKAGLKTFILQVEETI